jgi:NhaC family Na+:H+ antiporter
MIYYGLQILSPAIFLPATVIMLYNFYRDRKFLDHKCYSWYRFDRVGGALGFDLGMVAGAVISGAYWR